MCSDICHCFVADTVSVTKAIVYAPDGPKIAVVTVLSGCGGIVRIVLLVGGGTCKWKGCVWQCGGVSIRMKCSSRRC